MWWKEADLGEIFLALSNHSVFVMMLTDSYAGGIFY